MAYSVFTYYLLFNLSKMLFDHLKENGSTNSKKINDFYNYFVRITCVLCVSICNNQYYTLGISLLSFIIMTSFYHFIEKKYLFTRKEDIIILQNFHLFTMMIIHFVFTIIAIPFAYTSVIVLCIDLLIYYDGKNCNYHIVN